MSATIVDALPEGERWLYEVKLDGYRALIVKDGERVRLVSRNEKDLTAAYPSATTAAKRLNADSAVVDGEIVAVDAQGRPSFQALQHRGAHPRRHLSVCRPAEQQSLPLGRGRHRGADDRDAVGEPKVLAQIRFVEWTADDHLRHAAFLGLRDDKPARSVTRES
jgi:ATP-dependent DNA ligase